MPKNGDTPLTVSVTPPTLDEPAERLRKVPALVPDRCLAVIRRAVLLKQATLGGAIEDNLENTGDSLTLIYAEWMAIESARLSGRGGNGG